MGAPRRLKERNTFGNKSIARRPKPSHPPSPASSTSRWKPKAPFRLFDLPPELRCLILELALMSCDEQAQVLQIFLASRRLYSEAAEIFYHDMWLDITDRTRPPGLFAQPATPLSPRLHVRTIDLKIYLKKNLGVFNEVYVPLLRDMARHGNLHTLHLEINNASPLLDLWNDLWANATPDDEDGGDDDRENDCDEFCETEIPLLVGPNTDVEFVGPAFLAAKPFQVFLDFLADPCIPNIGLYVTSKGHYEFWCRFHRPVCAKRFRCVAGWWPGKSSRLRIHRQRFARFFRNARAVEVSTAG
ncbi:hypothetical protein F4777DRAFT_554483 [Nemania sp. FL0916]|nr:hypothetical protein F4777DRAFT_554483 [Nemania sp. FL0916]